MKKYFWLILMGVTILGGILRLVNLDKNPPHLGNDEISIAYDSYSVRMIGKDEHGISWPLSFKSHQTYKAPLYAYVNMPINWLLGNNEYGVRALSALAGIVTIIFIGLIGKEIGGSFVGLAAAVLLATNPKGIFASRIAFESNLAMAVLTIGLWAMIKFRNKGKVVFTVIAGLLMGLSIWGYHTEWGLTPMIFVVWVWLSRKEINIKRWWMTGLLVVILAVPIFYNFVTVQVLDVNNRANSQLWFSSGQFKDYLKNSRDGKTTKILKTVTAPIYSYIEHFGLETNFSSGADLFNKRSPMASGWFLLMTLPLAIIGLLKGKVVFGKWWSWLISWWLLCPIVPAMTGQITSVRNLMFIVPTSLIMAAGLKTIWERRQLFWIYVALFWLNFGYFCMGYFIHYPIDMGNNFQYGYKQAWEAIKPNINDVDNVVVESRFGEFGQFTGVPHLYFGYFGAFTPLDMQRRMDANGGTKIGKFTFKYVDWNQENYVPKTIYIVSAINPKAGVFYDKLIEVGMIRNTDFKPQFLMYKTKDIND